MLAAGMSSQQAYRLLDAATYIGMMTPAGFLSRQIAKQSLKSSANAYSIAVQMQIGNAGKGTRPAHLHPDRKGGFVKWGADD